MDILQYINKMNRLYGNDSTPVRFNTQKYLQGGRVGYQSGQLVQPGLGRQGYAGVKGMKSKKTGSRAYNMTPAEDTFAKQEWKVSGSKKEFNKWWEDVGHTKRNNVFKKFDRQTVTANEVKKIRAQGYITSDELAAKLDVNRNMINNARNTDAYQALKPKTLPGKGTTKNFWFKDPTNVQIEAINKIHIGSGGGQGGLRPSTVKSIQKLHNDKIFTRFLKTWDGTSNIPDHIIKKIFTKESAYSPNTLMNYGRALEGKEVIEGITPDKALAKKIQAGIKFKSGAAGPMTGSWHTAARGYVLRELDAIFNPKNMPGKGFDMRARAVRGVLEKYGLGTLQVDEIQALRTGLSGGTEPYSIFSQILTKKMNQKLKGNIFDPQTSKRQIRLNKAIEKFGKNSDEVAAIIREQDNFVKQFKLDYPEFKNVNLARFDLRNPIEVMGEKRFYSLPEEAQKSILKSHADRGYSLNLGKKLTTQKELATKLDQPAFRKQIESLLQTAKNVKGSGKVKAVASIAALVGGYTADQLLKEHGISLTQDENEKVLEAGMLPTELIQEHPVTSTLGAAATLRGSKSLKGDPLKMVRKAVHTPVTWPLKKMIRSLGTPLAGAGFAGWRIHDELKAGKSLTDAVVDPIVGAELAFPSLFKENISKIIPDKYQNVAAKAGRKLLGLGKVGSRFMGPVGIGIGAVGSVYDAYKDYERRKEFLTPERKREAQKESFDKDEPMFKSGGKVDYDNYLPDIDDMDY